MASPESSSELPNTPQPLYTNFYTPENAHFYSTFRYVPLDKEYDEIRLIEIDTSSRRAHKMLQAVPIDRTGFYSAISYYSGNPKETRPIEIDGVAMNIFANLATAIDSVVSFWNRRYQGDKLMLWVDQICINQSDLVEKSHQVNFMREIYRRATQVFVSMPIEDDVRPAFEWLGNMYSTHQIFPRQRGYVPPAGMLYQNQPRTDRPLNDPKYPSVLWRLLYKVLQHPWWSRSWVYQEFIVASQVFFMFSEEHCKPWDELQPLLSFFIGWDTVRACQESLNEAAGINQTKIKYGPLVDMTDYCNSLDDDSCCYGCCGCCLLLLGAGTILRAAGCICFSWSCCPCYVPRRTMQGSSDGLQEHLNRLSSPNLARSLVERVIDGKLKWQHRTMDLSFLLRHAQNTETSDLKDKFYAFLGLAHPGYNIPINYDLSYSINTVLSDVARAIVTHEPDGLDILFQAGTAAHNRRLTTGPDPIPTWVPDWDMKENKEREKFNTALALPLECAAGGSSKSSISFLADRFGNTGRVLAVRGIMFETLGMPIATPGTEFKPWSGYGSSDGRLIITTTSIAHTGDELWVLFGMTWPVVLRRSSNRETTTLLAVANVQEAGQFYHGVMFGTTVTDDKFVSKIVRIV